MRYESLTRVLAVDLHPRRFGYVVVEDPGRLLDWGVCDHRRKGNSADVLARRRLRPLLELWRPALLVIRSPRLIQPKKNRGRGELLRLVLTEARNCRVRVRMSNGPAKKRTTKITKYDRIDAIAARFPAI